MFHAKNEDSAFPPYPRSRRGPWGAAILSVSISSALSLAVLIGLRGGPVAGSADAAPRTIDTASDPFGPLQRAWWVLDAEWRDPVPYAIAAEAALEERGADAAAYALAGKAHLRMGDAVTARRYLYLATVTPGPQADRERARALLEKMYK